MRLILFARGVRRGNEKNAGVWTARFESSSVPFAEYHYPFETKNSLRKVSGELCGRVYRPDQNLVLLYARHRRSAFGNVSFKNVISHGEYFLGKTALRCPRSKSNYTDPMANMDKFARTALRYYLMMSPVISWKDVKFSNNN